MQIRQIPSECQGIDETWSRIYLVVRTERDLNAIMLKDTSVALVRLRVEQPGKLAYAEKKGRKEGFKSGLKLGLFIPPALWGAIKLLPILFK